MSLIECRIIYAPNYRSICYRFVFYHIQKTNTVKLELSKAQKDIIGHHCGHLRIIACPGAGKTETVSRRVAELVGKGEKPSEIVAVTFTEKAASELKLRIRRILKAEYPKKSDFGDMYVGTIDSFCLQMLKQVCPEYKSFEVLDANRRTAFVDRWYHEIGLRDLQGGSGKWRTIRKFCSSVDIMITEKVDVSKVSNKVFAGCYERYLEKIRDERFFDFASTISTLLEVMKQDEVRRYVREHVRHVVFDEYQDVNGLQEDLLEALSEGAVSVCVVGDDDQNIFQWRGSSIHHIRAFDKKYSGYGVTTKKLEVNYRATGGLINVASRLIRNNTIRIPKMMDANTGRRNHFESGDIVHRHFDTDTEEFDFIVSTINGLHHATFSDRDGRERRLSYADMAIIVRTNGDAASVAGYLAEHDIPYVADSGTSVFGSDIVVLALDCIFYAFGHNGYNIDDVPDPEDLVRRYGMAVAKGDVEAFAINLEHVRQRAAAISAGGSRDYLGGLGLQEFYHHILNIMGAEAGRLSEMDLYGLAVLSRVIGDYEYVYRSLRAREVAGLKWFVRMFADSNYGDTLHADPGLADAVRIMTIWKAKGLEFPAVFMPSFEERRRPYPQGIFVDNHLYDSARYGGDEEDDRRACYVAVTRSQKYLFITGSARHEVGQTRTKPYAPRRFAAEMDGDEFSDTVKIRLPSASASIPPVHVGTIPSSFSELSLYERCPYDYRLRHDIGFNAGVPPAFGYGTNIHNILNKIHSDYIRNGHIPTGGEIAGMFDKMFYMRFAPGTQSENMRKAGIRVVENYVKVHGTDFERILETEKRFEFTLGDALISGSIDLLKRLDGNGRVGSLEIIDFKTDKGADYQLDHREQVRFYAYAVRAALGYLPKKATIHYLDTERTEDVDIGSADLEGTRRGIIEKVNMIKERSFKPTPDESKCRGCDFKTICPHKDFKVGPDLEEAPSSADRDDGSQDCGLAPPVVSDDMYRKARSLAADGIIRNPNGTYEVKSNSRPGQSYTVSNMRCTCRGFRSSSRRNPGTIPTCSHVEAVRILRDGS